jgi:hypothetical protein
MPRSKKNAAREAKARMTILEIGKAPEVILNALSEATSLDLNELGTLVQRSGYTIRRWRGMDDEAEIPASAANALEDLRSIVAMLIEADYSKRAVTSYLRSRNAGLGRDRPLDGLRSDIGEFARVEHVTQCFIKGIPPEQGRHVIERPRATLPVVVEDPHGEPRPGGGPSEPADASGPEARSTPFAAT